MKPKCIFIEGTDAVGKNELIRSIAKTILLSDYSTHILLMNFPQYWFVGHDIRLLQRGACDDMFEGATGYTQLLTRASLYALDRNIALLLALQYLQDKPNTLIISDRGPYSNCVTSGYLWANEIVTEEEVKDFITTKIQVIDKAMLENLEHISIFCAIPNGFSDSGIKNRKALDNYETEKPQHYSFQVYSKYANLPTVYTKDDHGWRDRQTIAREVLSLVNIEFPNKRIEKDVFNSNEVLFNAYSLGRLNIVGPRMFIKHFKLDQLLEEKMNTLLLKWEQLSLGYVLQKDKDRKEILDVLETKIALILKRNSVNINFPELSQPEIQRKEIIALLKEIPLSTRIFKRTSAGRLNKFFAGLCQSEQLKFFA